MSIDVFNLEAWDGIGDFLLLMRFQVQILIKNKLLCDIFIGFLFVN